MATSLSRKKLALNTPLLARILSSQGLRNGGFSTTSMGTLAFEEVRDSGSNDRRPYKSTAFILHGLLGCGRNWRSLSGLEDDSCGFKEPWDWPDVVIGRSFGGKVVLEYTESCPRGDYGVSAALPKQLWVLDSVPGEAQSQYGDGEVRTVLQTLKKLPSTFPSRKWLVDYMMEHGFSKSFSECNLKKSGSEMTLAFNLDIAIEMFDSFCKRSNWSLLENPPKGVEIDLVRAENNTRWDPDAIRRLESLAARERSGSEGKVEVHVLPNAGHWVHIDNPKGLLEIVAPKINAPLSFPVAD